MFDCTQVKFRNVVAVKKSSSGSQLLVDYH